MFYSKDKICGYNKLLNFIVGARSIGKTYAFKKYAIQKYLRNEETTWWVMRTSKEIEDITTGSLFFSDVSTEFEDAEFDTDLSCGYINKNIGIHFKSLSTRSLKAVSDPACTMIVFDEFIPSKGSFYLRGEVERFLELYITIARQRDVQVFFLANKVAASSPYFAYFGARLPTKNERGFFVGKDVVLEDVSTSYGQTARKTRMANILKNSQYGKYAYENISLTDDGGFIRRASGKAKPTFIIHGGYSDFLISCDNSYFFIQDADDDNASGLKMYASNPDYIRSDAPLLMPLSIAGAMLRAAFKNGRIFYDNSDVRSRFITECYTFLKK